MSDSVPQATTLWSNILLRSVVELRNCYEQLKAQLNPQAVEDFTRLFEATERLDGLLAPEEQGEEGGNRRHDLMNALAAIQGYSEMLQEDLGGNFEVLDDTLSRLLKAAPPWPRKFPGY